MTRARWALGALGASVLLLSGASNAGAAVTETFHASSTTANTNCAMGPCTLNAAATAAGMTDTIVLDDAGPYSLTAQLAIAADVLVEPQTAGLRPTITTPTSFGPSIILGPGAELDDVRVDFTATANVGMRLTGGILRRDEIWIDGTNSVAVSQAGGTIADSVVWDPSSGAGAVVFLPGTASLVNDTIVGGSIGIDASVQDAAEAAKNVTARNTILRGGSFDFKIQSQNTNPVNLTFDHVNYATQQVISLVGGSFTASASQSGSPAFVNAPSGDFRQQPVSTATIDLGLSGGFLGATDLSGGPRTAGPAPDIGADEFDPLPPASSANAISAAIAGPTGLRAAALKKCKKKKGAARKKCKKKALKLPV